MNTLINLPIELQQHIYEFTYEKNIYDNVVNEINKHNEYYYDRLDEEWVRYGTDSDDSDDEKETFIPPRYVNDFRSNNIFNKFDRVIENLNDYIAHINDIAERDIKYILPSSINEPRHRYVYDYHEYI